MLGSSPDGRARAGAAVASTGGQARRAMGGHQQRALRHPRPAHRARCAEHAASRAHTRHHGNAPASQRRVGAQEAVAHLSAVAWRGGRGEGHARHRRAMHVPARAAQAIHAGVSTAAGHQRAGVSHAPGGTGRLRAVGHVAHAKARHPTRPRTGDDRQARSRRLLSHRVGHRALRTTRRDSLSGSWLRRQFGGVLLPGHHGGRSHSHGAAVRAVFKRRTQRATRYRHRLRPPRSRARATVCV